ncbi:unnamed protein product [Closterium sp. Naga37s-1]|nr:unnamed protein product [Closterium sp. Naga37s-1]
MLAAHHAPCYFHTTHYDLSSSTTLLSPHHPPYPPSSPQGCVSTRRPFLPPPSLPPPRALLVVSSRVDSSHQPQHPVSCLPARPSACVPVARLSPCLLLACRSACCSRVALPAARVSLCLLLACHVTLPAAHDSPCHVRAAGNGFSGSLPATISALTGLSELSLSHNALEGPFSASPAAPHLVEFICDCCCAGEAKGVADGTADSAAIVPLSSPPLSPFLLFLHLPPTHLSWLPMWGGAYGGGDSG